MATRRQDPEWVLEVCKRVRKLLGQHSFTSGEHPGPLHPLRPVTPTPLAVQHHPALASPTTPLISPPIGLCPSRGRSVQATEPFPTAAEAPPPRCPPLPHPRHPATAGRLPIPSYSTPSVTSSPLCAPPPARTPHRPSHADAIPLANGCTGGSGEGRGKALGACGGIEGRTDIGSDLVGCGGGQESTARQALAAEPPDSGGGSATLLHRLRLLNSFSTLFERSSYITVHSDSCAGDQNSEEGSFRGSRRRHHPHGLCREGGQNCERGYGTSVLNTCNSLVRGSVKESGWRVDR